MLHKFLFFSLLLAFLAQPFVGLSQNTPAKPKQQRLFNDFSKTLSAQEADFLEQHLLHYNQQTGQQMAVVLVPSLDGSDIESYANKLFNDWGIGDKKAENGVLFLAAIQDRRMRFEVGYGNEGNLPDVIAKRIIEQQIKPYFQQGNYAGGIYVGTTTAMQHAVPDYTPLDPGKIGTTKAKKSVERRSFTWKERIVGIIIAILLIWLFAKNPWLLLLLLSSRGGSYGNFSGGRGGFGGGGGGFGGFGGGRSGGGGASGGW